MSGRRIPGAHAEEIAALDAIIAELDEIRKSAQSKSAESGRQLLGEPWPLFIRRMRLLSSQSWGPKVEQYFRELHGWEEVDPAIARGDARERNGKKQYFEMKSTIITQTNPNANFVQIRPHHKVDGYQLFVVDVDYSVVHYRLTKYQMEVELTKIGSLAHGTTGAGGKQMKNAEWAIRFEWSKHSPVRKRWARYEVGTKQSDRLCCDRH
jgi:hypothetical protein